MNTAHDVKNASLSRNVRRLLRMRSALIVSLLVFFVFVTIHPELEVHQLTIWLILSGYVLVNVVSMPLLRSKKDISERIWFVQLLLDVLILTLLIYFSGGYTNPFISLYLFPLIIASTTLPRRETWLMGAIVIACYTLLIFFYEPLLAQHMVMHETHQNDVSIQLHLSGMWFSFVLSVLLLMFFVTGMSQGLREQDQKLAQLREQALRNEHVVALGALAAGTAHELGTPLATMTIITHEMIEQYADHADIAEQSQLMQEELKRCKKALSQLSISSGYMRAEGGKVQALDRYMQQLVDQWTKLRGGREPSLQLSMLFQSTGTMPKLLADLTLTQALLNLLNNSADAGATHIELRLTWSERTIHLKIIDNGEGIPSEVMQKIGQPFVSSKTKGRGLGVFLSRAVFERLGGSLNLEVVKPHGICAYVQLPRVVHRNEESA